MLAHNPECTNGTAHAYEACRDRHNQPLKMLELPDPASEESQEPQDPGQLTQAERDILAAAAKGAEAAQQAEPGLEVAARAFGGLLEPVAVEHLAGADADALPGANRIDLSAHDPHANPDADADAAQRGE